MQLYSKYLHILQIPFEDVDSLTKRPSNSAVWRRYSGMPNLEGEEKVIKSNIKVSPPSCDNLYPALRGPQVPPPQVENISIREPGL